MRFCDYTPLGLRTESKNDQLSDQEILFYRLGHALLGFDSEITEIREPSEPPDLAEEYGDMFWYLNLACDSVGSSLDEIDYEVHVDADLMDPIDGIIYEKGIIADQLKRAIYYGKPERFDTGKVKQSLAKIKINLIAACEDLGENHEDILDANIRKLSERYPELKFDMERAFERNLQREKAALQG